MDKIGSCVRSSRTLSSNKGEIESYFPALIGLAPNNENFISRVKAYLNNISVSVDELGKTFDISFFGIVNEIIFVLELKKKLLKLLI